MTWGKKENQAKFSSWGKIFLADEKISDSTSKINLQKVGKANREESRDDENSNSDEHQECLSSVCNHLG